VGLSARFATGPSPAAHRRGDWRDWSALLLPADEQARSQTGITACCPGRIEAWSVCLESVDTSCGPPTRWPWACGIAIVWAWRQRSGPTVFATFESGTDYFGSTSQQTMINFRVRDLDAMLAQLRAKGADVARQTQDMEGVGRFGWVTDPEGNRVELWQPP
jgi:Glyoxalase-like domain